MLRDSARRLVYLAVIAVVVGSFLWQMARGVCPVP
jgi:hypothetical protein